MIDNEKIREFARDRLSCGYVWGATGWVCTPARRKAQAARYPAHRHNILSVCKKWDGKKCYDCAQFTRYALKAGGLSLPSGATSQWKKGDFAFKGEIGFLPQTHMCLLFRQNGSKMAHVGLYMGDGTVIHAAGSAKGVVQESIDSTWTHIACWDFVPEMSGENAVVTAKSGSTVNLRQSPSLKGALLMRIKTGQCVTILSREKDWAHICYNGQCGWMMLEFLQSKEESHE